MTQLDIVYAAMSDGAWWTYRSLQEFSRDFYQRGISETAVSARIRDFRKLKYGKYVVQRRPTGINGVWEYKLDHSGRG